MRETTTIVGLEVIGISDGRVVGRVSEVVCDLASGRVLGLITGEGAAEKGVAAEDIVIIGEDAVMIPASASARPLSQMPELERYRRGPGTRPLEVVTDDGRRIGRVVRVWIDPFAKVVTRYEVSQGLVQDLANGRITLPIIPGTVHGRDTIVVPASYAMELAGQAGGLRKALRKLSQSVREQTAAAREKAEEAARLARERVREAVEKAKEAAAEAAKQSEGQPEQQEQPQTADQEPSGKLEEREAPAGGETQGAFEEPAPEAKSQQESDAEDTKGCNEGGSQPDADSTQS
ncbi:MAG: PRC-barrel domain-containing protein [Armatimonadetes bacterium]|nr:PRC-barrel domain-containing protein [Armatimonadota bacterium]